MFQSQPPALSSPLYRAGALYLAQTNNLFYLSGLLRDILHHLEEVDPPIQQAKAKELSEFNF
jgi:hypothetical protein